MPYRLQAAFWVGVIGTVAALPLLVILRFQNSYISAGARGGGWFAAPPEEAA